MSFGFVVEPRLRGFLAGYGEKDHFIQQRALRSSEWWFPCFVCPKVSQKSKRSRKQRDEQGYVAGMNNAYMSMGNIVAPTLEDILRCESIRTVCGRRQHSLANFFDDTKIERKAAG